MKTTRHPTYGETTIMCACGADLSHALDGPAAPRRRLCRLSSVVDGPAEAGRDRRAGRKIPREVCATQRAPRSKPPPVPVSRVPLIHQDPAVLRPG